MLTNEIWVGVPGLENLYQVSFKGSICRLLNNKERARRPLKPWIGTDGRLRVSLSFGQGRSKTVQLHRLVAQAFLAQPIGATEVLHKVNDFTDNRVDNLYWATSSHRALNSVRNFDAEQRGRCYRVTSPDGTTHQIRNLSRFCRQNGLTADRLHRVARGAAKNYKGWKAEYV